MYDNNTAQSSMPKSEMVRQCDLPQIHSEFIEVNEKTNALISNIRAAINRIKVMEESPVKNPSNPERVPGDDTFVGSMRVHLNFARKNADDLDNILRHLNSLV